MQTYCSLKTAGCAGGLPALVFIFLFIVVGCKKDDNAGLFINAEPQTFTVNGINNCNTSSGKGSTFVLDIPYTASPGLVIQQLKIKTRVSDGGSDEAVNTMFSDNGSTISWASCFRFGSQSWAEYEVQLESSGGVRSNPTTVRIDRPNGAN